MRLNSVFIVLGLAAAVCAMPMPAAEGADKGATPGATGTGADLATDGSTGAPKTGQGASSKTAHGDLVTKITDIKYEKREDKKGSDKKKERRATSETPAPGGTPAPGSTPDPAGTSDGKSAQTHTESKGSAIDADHTAKKEAVAKFLRSAAEKAKNLNWDRVHLTLEWADEKGKGALETRGKKGGEGNEHELMFDISFEAGHVCGGRCHAHIKSSKNKKITGSIYSEKKKQLFSGAA